MPAPDPVQREDLRFIQGPRRPDGGGGGLAQPADPPGTDPATAYFDPPLTRDGKPVKAVGYCTDVFAESAAGFVAAADERPFFAYVAFNAPHDPFQVPARFADPYRKRNLKPGDFPAVGQPWAGGKFDASGGIIFEIEAEAHGGQRCLHVVALHGPWLTGWGQDYDGRDLTDTDRLVFWIKATMATRRDLKVVLTDAPRWSESESVLS